MNSRLIKGPVRAYKKIAEIERLVKQQQQQEQQYHQEQQQSGLSEEFVLRGSAMRINEICTTKAYSRSDLTTAKSANSLTKQKFKSKSLGGGDGPGGQLHIKIDDYVIDDFANPKNVNEFMSMLHLSPVPLEAMDLHDSMLSGEIYDPNYAPSPSAKLPEKSLKSSAPPKPLNPEELVQVLADEENPYPSIIQYHTSGFQADLYNQIYPHADDVKYHSHGPVCQYFIHAFTYSGGKLNRELFDLAFKKTRKAFPELKTFFYRNDLIIDADVQAYLPGSALPQYKVWSTHNKQWIEYVEKNDRDSKFITNHVQQFIKTHSKMEQLFKMFVFDALSEKPILILLFSNLIADEVSSHTVVNELIRNYKAVSAKGPENHRFKRILARDYIYAQQCEFMHQKVAPSTWSNAINVIRDQVTEFAQVEATSDDKDKVKDQLAEAKRKKEYLQQQVNMCLLRCEELSKEIDDASGQRRAIDQPLPGQGGILWSYIDSVSKEVVQIHHHDKNILVKAVLGEDAPGDTIDFFLKKHEVTTDTLDRLEAEKMTVEKFLQLDSKDLENLKIAQGERRKISALVDYVRSTVKESVEEQGKVKFVLERRVQRARRDLDAAESKLEVMRREYDRAEEDVIRCEIALNPSVVKRPIPLLRVPYGGSLETVNDELPRGVPASFKDYSTAYAFQPMNFPSRQDIEEHLTDFAETGPRTIHILTLSALSIIMRHVCGKSRFVLGHSVQNRIDPLQFSDNMIYNTPVGPWTRVVPFQVDLRDLQVTLQDFMKETSAKYVKVSPLVDFICPSLMSKVMEGCMYEENSAYVDAGMYGFPVQYQYIGPYHPLNKDEAEPELQDEWLVNENDLSDLKFYVREFEDGHVEGGIWFRPDLIGRDKVKKWAERLQAVMASTANNQAGKLTISNLIGRFYQKLWTDTNTSMVGLGSTFMSGSKQGLDASMSALSSPKSPHILGSSYRMSSTDLLNN